MLRELRDYSLCQVVLKANRERKMQCQEFIFLP